MELILKTKITDTWLNSGIVCEFPEDQIVAIFSGGTTKI